MEIQNFKSINKGALKASFEVYIPEWDLTIKNVCYFQKDEGNKWISYPSKEVTTLEGKKKYYPNIVFGERVGPKLLQAIHDKIQDLISPAVEAAADASVTGPEYKFVQQSFY